MWCLKTFILIFILLFTLVHDVSTSSAEENRGNLLSSGNNSFINIVMPVRGGEFWEHRDKTPSESFQNYFSLIESERLPATWLLRFDALKDPAIVGKFKATSNQEVGLFLEVTPTLAEISNVTYKKSDKWHAAGSILVTGYAPEDRRKLIDTYFNSFKETFGYFPKSVGAWWIDGASLEYMNQKYGVVANLMVSDQLSTDQYEVWGQYWSTPFYPSKYNPSQPAQDVNNKTNTVTLQWAARDPYKGYGGRVEESTRSVQANDYLLHPGLDINYFTYLLDVYVKENINPFGQVSIGIENDFVNPEYVAEFARQLAEIKSRSNTIQVLTMADFANWYKKTYPDLSPTKVIYATEYQNPGLPVVWYQSTIYRAGVFGTGSGLFLRDLRSYSDMMKEPCLEKSCEELYLSRTTSRALDFAAFGQQFVLAEGPVNNFELLIEDKDPKIKFVNDLGISKEIVFQKNDLTIDKKIWTVPTLIIESTSDESSVDIVGATENSLPNIDPVYIVLSTLVFIFSIIFLVYLPGRLVSNYFKSSFYEDIILSSIFGIAIFLIVSLVFGIFKLDAHGLLMLFILGLLGFRIPFNKPTFQKKAVLPLFFLIVGAFVSVLPVVNSGLFYGYGLGFWGPNGHDAIWHLSLIESLRQSFPPENFALSGTTLSNYHYYFDLIIARLSLIPYLDTLSLYFRFWPIWISLLLGGSVWLLADKLKLNFLSTSVLLFMTFFAGSWGWILTLINKNEISGESLFWSSQAISLHLNPPFALSLVFLIGIFIMLFKQNSKKSVIIVSILIALLWGIKAYAGVLIIIGLIIYSIIQSVKYRNYYYLMISVVSILLSICVLFFSTTNAKNLFEFSPLWIVDSMIGADDRLGLTQLSTMRDTYIAENEILKLSLINTLFVIMFIVGNFGARIIALPLIMMKLFNSSLTQLFAMITLVGLIISLLFIQKGNSWNIIQFLYYSLFIGSIFTALSFEEIYNFLRSRSKVVLSITLIFLLTFIVLGAVTTFGSLKDYYPNSAHSAINYEELKALELLKNQDPGVVMTIPFSIQKLKKFYSPVPLKFYVTNSYVSAFTKKPTFIADEMNLEIMGVDYKRRLYSTKEYFKDPRSDWSKNFLKDNNIKYIYISKHQDFNDENTNLEKLLENNEVKIFKVN